MKSPLLHVLALFCAAVAPLAIPHAAGAQSYLKASDESIRWWQDARFGMFVHWGPVSLEGTEIGWSRGGERWGRGGTGTVPVDVYDTLYERFNPVEFDPVEWVRIAKEAGMRYIVFTTKHHDGFSMFDSAVTDYRITSPRSPYGKDITGMLASACHEAGMKLGFYYSPVDWYHPDYRTERHDRYIDFMHDQVRELCTNYGAVDIMWFDGLQIHPMSGSGGENVYDPAWAKDWRSNDLFRMMRELQPTVVINNRCGLEGDFDTPEQHVGFFQTNRPWESCITIGTQWAWKPNDRLKSATELIRTLARCAGGDGNLLLNVGPMPSGAIEERQVAQLSEMGQWLAVNGESIYGTRGGPVTPASWGVTTRKGTTVYVHVLGDDQVIAIPRLTADIRSARLIGGGDVPFETTADGTVLKIPQDERNPHDSVVVLQFVGIPKAIK